MATDKLVQEWGAMKRFAFPGYAQATVPVLLRRPITALPAPTPPAARRGTPGDRPPITKKRHPRFITLPWNEVLGDLPVVS